MNIICWNCRGTAGKGFGSLMRDLQNKYDTKFCILLETHTSGDKAKSIVRKFGLNGSFIQEAHGFACGIWCLWDQAVWKVKVIRSSSQFVHMEVQWKNDPPSFLTAVYGSPHMARRQQLWDNIANLAGSFVGAWALIGDFNCTLVTYDRR